MDSISNATARFSRPGSKAIFGKTFCRAKDRSMQSCPTKKTSQAKETTLAPSPITQGSANKARGVFKSPALAEAEFSSINRLFAEIDASELDTDLGDIKQVKPEGGKSAGAEKETSSGKVGSVQAKPARGKTKESKGVTKRKEGKTARKA